MVDAGAIAHLAQLTLNPDAKLKRQVFSALSQISKHSVELAEMVVEAEIFPNILTCLKGTIPRFKLPSMTALSWVLLCFKLISASGNNLLDSSDSDEYVKKNCATLIREIAKHTPEVGPLNNPEL